MAKKPSKPPPKVKPSLRDEYPREYAAGQRAARSSIAKGQAPVFYSKDAEKAWHEGYDG